MSQIVFDSKFFYIQVVGTRGNYTDYVIVNKPKMDTVLGYINWFPQWKKYVFTTTENTVVFDIICLEEIIKFLKTLENENANSENQTETKQS